MGGGNSTGNGSGSANGSGNSGLTAAAVRQGKVLAWFQQTGRVYTLKELEKTLPAIGGVHAMQVKDLLQALQDDNLIRVEKIGSGNWYWCFTADATRARRAALAALQADHARLAATLHQVEADLRAEIADRAAADEGLAAEGRPVEASGGRDRATLVAGLEALRARVRALDAQLAAYGRVMDGATLRRQAEQVSRLRASAVCWSDNIESLGQFIFGLTGDRSVTGELLARACGEEYVEGEGLKELGIILG